MYNLQLANGTLIEGLQRINPSTFEIRAKNALNNLLTNNNLQMAILYDEDGLIVDLFIDYTLQSCFFQNNIFHFRIAEIAELEKQEQHRLEKEKKNRRKKRK